MTSFRLGWATDTHFDNFSSEDQDAFIEQCQQACLDSLVLTGDISVANRLLKDLERLQSALSIPLFFVCGNHDFYGSSIKSVRNELESIKSNHSLYYLTHESYVQLGKEVALVGHDTWYDGRYGNYMDSTIDFPDHHSIEEFINISKKDRFRLIKELADQATTHLEKQLPLLVKKFEKIVIAIHCPPFKESSLYENQVVNEERGPYFVAKGLGDYLLDFTSQHPKNKFLILCGHSHHECNVQISKNLNILTGGVLGKKPLLQKVISL
jgi:Icc protein